VTASGLFFGFDALVFPQAEWLAPAPAVCTLWDEAEPEGLLFELPEQQDKFAFLSEVRLGELTVFVIWSPLPLWNIRFRPEAVHSAYV